MFYQVSGAVFLRDVLFYVFALLMLLGVAFYGHFTIPWAVAFLALYVVFVVFVFLQDKKMQERRLKLMTEEAKQIDFSEEVLTEIDESNASIS